MPEPLEPAVDAVLRQMEKALHWKGELITELSAAETRLLDLRNSANRLIDCLPQGERLSRRIRLNRNRLEEQQLHRAQEPAHRAGYVLLRMLATHYRGQVTNGEVMRHLKRLGIPATPEVVAKMLYQKAKQGVLERIGRGRYRFERSHPMLGEG